MTLNIRDLAHLNEFSLELKSLGTIRCLSLNTGHLFQANRKLRTSSERSTDFVRWLFSKMARRRADKHPDGDNSIEDFNLTTEELSIVTDGDIEEFAEKLIQKNWHLLKTHKGSNVVKLADESACDFLIRVFHHHAAEQKAQWYRMTESASPSHSINTAMSAMKNNLIQQSALDSIAEVNRYITKNSVTAAMESLRCNQDLARITNSLQGIKLYLDQSSAGSILAKAIYRNEDALRGAVRGLVQSEKEAMSAAITVELEKTVGLLKSYEATFRFPQISEATSLLALHQVGAVAKFAQQYTQKGLDQQRFLEAITTPWVNRVEEARSVTAILELQSIGTALRSAKGFDLELTKALRLDLGDWRDKIIFPKSVFIDPVVRTDFYVTRGFNTALTDFPEAAFHQSLHIAGLDVETLDFEQYGTMVQSSTDPEEEAGLQRTNKCHDQLQRFERRLRQFINNAMTAQYGSDWPKKRLAPKLYEAWEFKKQRAESNGIILAFIEVADFTDYETIICKQDHWREIFETIFKKKESVRESLQRLQPIRLAAMHARIVTKADELYLFAEVVRLLSAIK